MNNHESTRIDTNPERLLFKDEVFQIVGCAIEVLNALGHGIEPKTRVRANRLMNWCPFVSIRGY